MDVQDQQRNAPGTGVTPVGLEVVESTDVTPRTATVKY
jgi:hypothetical protein